MDGGVCLPIVCPICRIGACEAGVESVGGGPVSVLSDVLVGLYREGRGTVPEALADKLGVLVLHHLRRVGVAQVEEPVTFHAGANRRARHREDRVSGCTGPPACLSMTYRSSRCLSCRVLHRRP